MIVDIKTLALGLLIGRLVSVTFLVFVLKRQIELFKFPISPEIRNFRRGLFALSLAIFLGNGVPILIDALTYFADLTGRANPSGVGVAYAISNCTTSILASFLIWLLYRMASRGQVPDQQPGRRKQDTLTAPIEKGTHKQ